MSRELNDSLNLAFQAMRNINVEDDSLERALVAAKQIANSSNASIPPIPQARNATVLRPWRRSEKANLRIRRAAPAAALLCVAVAGIAAIFFGADRKSMAFAEVRTAMANLKAVHLMIGTEADGDAGPVEVWYQRGVGFAMTSALGWEIDDGTSFWDYSQSQKQAIRSKSRLSRNGYANLVRLGKAMGFHFDDVPDELPRFPAEDRNLHGDRCRAYVWDLKHEDLPGDDVAPDEPNRRTLFLVDEAKRIRHCDYERKRDSRWTSYRSVVVSYPDEIPADRFVPKFADDVRILEAPAPSDGQGLEAIDPDVARLVAGIERRHSAYEGLRFTYDVTTEVKLSPTAALRNRTDLTDGVLHARDVFAVLSPDPERSDRRWRYWRRDVKNEADQWTLDRFCAYDGRQSNSFQRFDAHPAGSIVPWESVDHFGSNLFDRFLFLRLNGLGDTDPLSDELRMLHLDRFHVVGKGRSKFGEVYKLLGRSSAEFGVEYLVEMTGEPDFKIIRWEARYAKQERRSLELFEIKELRKHNGVSYPAQGTYRQAPIGELNEVTYAFNVIGVEALRDDARKNWLPPWPPSTPVMDQTKPAEAAPD